MYDSHGGGFAARRRAAGEEWINCIQESTHQAVDAAEAAGVKCWVRQRLEAKWKWAGHLARLSTYRADSQALKVTMWRNYGWKIQSRLEQAAAGEQPRRSRPGRWRMWETEIIRYTEDSVEIPWELAALERTDWHNLSERFYEYCRKWFGAWAPPSHCLLETSLRRESVAHL